MHGWKSCEQAGTPKPTATVHGVLCDTSFFIRFAKPGEALHSAAQDYLRFLVEGGHELYVSTIALAEYAVRDSIDNLPLRYFRVLPFNIDHAQRAAAFARAVFQARRSMNVQMEQRAVIANDTKLFAQADTVPSITHYLTADQQCEKVYTLLKSAMAPCFQFVHLSTPWHRTFGCLDLPI